MVLGPLLELRRNVERLYGSAECKLVAQMENTRGPSICSCAYAGANKLTTVMLLLRPPSYNYHCVFTQLWSKTDVCNYAPKRGLKRQKGCSVWSGLAAFTDRIISLGW